VEHDPFVQQPEPAQQQGIATERDLPGSDDFLKNIDEIFKLDK
jgi:hypothetical protein